MREACSGTQASDRFGIVLDFVTKLHNGTITDEEAKRFLRREDPFRSGPPVSQPQSTWAFFSHVATTNLAAVKGKKTKQCFTGRCYAYRDNDFDRWLPANQSDADRCVVTTLAPMQDWIFAEAAAKALGVGAGTEVKTLGRALIENSHTMTLPQIEEMVEATERGEKTGMRTDGWGNFFFVETGNEDDPVSVVYVIRDERDWHAYVDGLAYAYRWRAAYRLLVRNLDTAKLGL